MGAYWRNFDAYMHVWYVAFKLLSIVRVELGLDLGEKRKTIDRVCACIKPRLL